MTLPPYLTLTQSDLIGKQIEAFVEKEIVPKFEEAIIKKANELIAEKLPYCPKRPK